MIDLGLTKLALIGVVALIVIGPEKLPRVARMAGTLFGRAQRYINNVKAEVSREMELDELRKMHADAREAVTSAGQSFASSVGQLDKDMNDAWHDNDFSQNAAIKRGTFAAASEGAFAMKAKDFRKKRLARTTAFPSWYKQQTGHRGRIISGAARVARYRPASARASSSFFQ
jgi:sec-independent protein translocase protein TatB